MENTKENLEVQRYDINEILGAVMCMEDNQLKDFLVKNYTLAGFMNVFDSQENYEGAIKGIESYIEYYELTLRAFRELADILQVPKNFAG